MHIAGASVHNSRPYLQEVTDIYFGYGQSNDSLATLQQDLSLHHARSTFCIDEKAMSEVPETSPWISLNH
jgi:hypothetical protein